MNKKELMKMRSLKPTNKMMNIAANDAPIMKPLPWNRKSYENIYKYNLHIRCQVFNGIMKIALFMTEYMRCGSKKPIYEIFIDYEKEQFITYDCKSKKWRDAMLENLSFPGAYYYYHERTCYVSSETRKCIKKHLKVKTGDFNGINEYQKRIRSKQLDNKHKKITDPWDADLSQIPVLPKDWDKWVQRVGITDHYIFYKYKREGAKIGYCTRCGKIVPIKKAQNGKAGTCSCCRKPITYRSIGKLSSHFSSTREYAYLIQKCRDGFVIREFIVNFEFEKDSNKKPKYNFSEVRRCIYESVNKARAYYLGNFKQKETRWILTEICNYYGRQDPGKVYGKSLRVITQLNRTGLLEMIKNSYSIDPEIYLSVYKQKPYIERVAKAGLFCLCKDFINETNRYYSVENSHINSNYLNDELHKMLNIDKQLLKRLRNVNGGIEFLSWLQYEKKRNKCIPDETIVWFIKNGVKTNDIKFITDRMNEVQICKYIKQQMALANENAKFVLDTWQDYLEMAKRLKLNVLQEINYKPRYLVEKHNKCIEIIGDANTAREANEICIKYPDVDDICQSLSDKYEYTGEKYSVVAPKQIEDILNDSNELNHCVATSPDRYFERIQNRESYILFLRKNSSLDVPYYTLEVEPNGTVRQTRTKFNTQGNDIDDIKKFLVLWQKHIYKKLSDEDIMLGEKSNEIRLKEYSDLRTKKAVIQRGTYQGKLLADVLEADLLLNNRRCS